MRHKKFKIRAVVRMEITARDDEEAEAAAEAALEEADCDDVEIKEVEEIEPSGEPEDFPDSHR